MVVEITWERRLGTQRCRSERRLGTQPCRCVCACCGDGDWVTETTAVLAAALCFAMSPSCAATWKGPFLNGSSWPVGERVPSGSRRRDCHFDDTPSPSMLKHMLTGEGGTVK